MNVYSISDLHLSINSNKPMDIFGPVWENSFEKIVEDWNKKIKDDDVVLLCGDLSWAMRLEDAQEDIKLLDSLKGKKILLKGNHDFWWQSITALRNILPKNFYAIQNDAVKIENFIFCGTRGWLIPEGKQNTEENKRIFHREVERLKLSLNAMQNLRSEGDIVICLMHYPPFNVLEEDNEMTNLLEKFGVNCVAYGHLHGNRNGYKFKTTKKNIEYFLTSCDLVENSLVKII